MAANKSRKSKYWIVKWILIYILTVFVLVSVSIATAIYVDNAIAKTIGACYAIIIILIAIAVPLVSFVIAKKESNKEVQYGLSKEEYDKYLQQAKNCDIYAK